MNVSCTAILKLYCQKISNEFLNPILKFFGNQISNPKFQYQSSISSDHSTVFAEKSFHLDYHDSSQYWLSSIFFLLFHSFTTSPFPGLFLFISSFSYFTFLTDLKIQGPSSAAFSFSIFLSQSCLQIWQTLVVFTPNSVDDTLTLITKLDPLM